jgi:ectoine hydroxylase-related dioxygenase (phytanoyl-CoA dioxygenase family)
MNADYDNEGNGLLLGDKTYQAYEDMIQKKLAENVLSKKTFTARKGDILIWHANLFHGGEKHLNKAKTRKSVVFHYFGKDAICYHEITQRPALMEPERD